MRPDFFERNKSKLQSIQRYGRILEYRYNNVEVIVTDKISEDLIICKYDKNVEKDFLSN